jgi:CreA protein
MTVAARKPSGEHQAAAHPVHTASRGAVAAATACVLALFASTPAFSEEIGSVDTVFKLIGPNHKIVVEAFDDPGVTGVTCHVARAKAGGISGAVGLAEDPSEASIACRQVGPISFPRPLPPQQEVFNERASILFKRIRIVRMVDARRNTLVYLTYSDKLIEGSPKNSVTAVPVDRGTPIPLKR